MNNIAWAAGIFTGEGCTGRVFCKNSSGVFEYLSLQIGMYDERSIARFATIFSASYRGLFLRTRQRWFYKVHLRGRPAERAIARMWPYLKGTDKGDQAYAAADRLGVADWITGKRRGERPQLQNVRRGRKAA
jgi:hypothetical protein